MCSNGQPKKKKKRLASLTKTQSFYDMLGTTSPSRENSRVRGGWQATVHGVVKNWT